VVAAAIELAGRGIRANVISPGPIDTGWMTPEIRHAAVAELRPAGLEALPIPPTSCDSSCLTPEAGSPVRFSTAVAGSRHRGEVRTRTALCRAIPGVAQHAAQVDDHLLVNVLPGRRPEEFELGPYFDGDPAVMTHGDLADSFQQRHDRPPLNVVAGGMLHDLAHRIAMTVVKMLWSRRGHVPTLPTHCCDTWRRDRPVCR